MNYEIRMNASIGTRESPASTIGLANMLIGVAMRAESACNGAERGPSVFAGRTPSDR